MRKKVRIEFEYNDNPHEFTTFLDIDDSDSVAVIQGKVVEAITREAGRIYGLGGHGAFRALKAYEFISE